MRRAEIKRTTNETDIYLELNIDGSGKSDIDTGCGFLDHMLTLFARHGRFDLTVKCKGDTPPRTLRFVSARLFPTRWATKRALCATETLFSLWTKA